LRPVAFLLSCGAKALYDGFVTLIAQAILISMPTMPNSAACCRKVTTKSLARFDRYTCMNTYARSSRKMRI